MSLLDADKGGHFRIVPDRDDYVSRQLYFPDTAVLITRFLPPDGVGEIYDFMPVAGSRVTDRHRIVRQLRVVRGTMRFVLDLAPGFDYARAKHTVQVTPDGATFTAEGGQHGGLTLHVMGASDSSLEEQGIKFEQNESGLRVTRTLNAGQTWGVVCESNGGPPRRLHPDDVQRLLAASFRRDRPDGHSTASRTRSLLAGMFGAAAAA